MDKLPSLSKLSVDYVDSNNMPMGTDAELFITSARGKVFSAHKTNVGEVKKDKYGNSNQNIIRDGAALELHFDYGMGCREELGSAINRALGQAVAVANKHKGTISCAPALPILKTHLRSAPEDVKSGGCQPDRNAYNGQPKSAFGYVDDMRYAGGHMHFGFWQAIDEPLLLENMDTLTKFLDRVTILLDWGVSIPMVAMLGKTFADGEADRRQFYGQAGSYRYQRWGYEYRVPSSRILLSPAFLTLVYGMARSLMQSTMNRSVYLRNGSFISDLTPKIALLEKLIDTIDFDFDEVRRIIDKHDFAAAQEEWTNGKVGQFWRWLDGNKGYRPYVKATDLIVRSDQEGVHFDGKNFMKHWQRYNGSNGIAQCMATDITRSATSWSDPRWNLQIMPQLELLNKPFQDEDEFFDDNEYDRIEQLEDGGDYPDDYDGDYDDDYDDGSDEADDIIDYRADCSCGSCVAWRERN